MVGSKDLKPSNTNFFPKVFFQNQFRAKPIWPAPNTTLSGKTAIITGGNTGLGYETAVQMLELKLSLLILAVRSADKGEAAAATLRKLHPESTIEVWLLDMNSYDSILAFARRVESSLAYIDMVLLNAGVIKLSFMANESTGYEEMFQVNYLSTMLLCILLLPILKVKGASKNCPAYVTIVNAALTLAATFPNRDARPLFPTFKDQKQFNQEEHYNTSKLLAHMFLWNLVEYISADHVIVNLADPAWVKGTDFTRDVKGATRIGLKIFELAGRTKRVGASCFVDALVNKGKESHGCFLMSWKIHP
jgi:NAD(P)-dependent dehydrogenase (short-subunit alcohol dehydrogenase family)